MEEKILASLLLRPGMEGKEVILADLITDSIQEIKDYLNYGEADTLPLSLKSTVQELVIIKVNRMGAEGLQSESYSGVSQTYIEGLPQSLKATLRKYRRLPR